MNKCTAGPWRIHPYEPLSICGDRGENVTHDIARVMAAGKWEMVAANARLIAAAPELFEACKAALIYVQSDPAVYPLTEKLRAAIAAAEKGKS